MKVPRRVADGVADETVTLVAEFTYVIGGVNDQRQNYSTLPYTSTQIVRSIVCELSFGVQTLRWDTRLIKQKRRSKGTK